MKWLPLLPALLLVSCGFFDNPKTEPLTDNMLVSVLIVDDDVLPANTFADASANQGFCVVRIKRSVYPDCIKHEIRHCFEGNWHVGHESHDDCFHD